MRRPVMQPPLNGEPLSEAEGPEDDRERLTPVWLPHQPEGRDVAWDGRLRRLSRRGFAWEGQLWPASRVGAG